MSTSPTYEKIKTFSSITFLDVLTANVLMQLTKNLHFAKNLNENFRSSSPRDGQYTDDDGDVDDAHKRKRGKEEKKIKIRDAMH